MIYFNEHDAGPAQWLRNAFPSSQVDERSIVDVTSADLISFLRVHLFAGIGGWELALQLAGWPDDLPVWTGSCPCQPFSQAGKQLGTADERHLWPEMRRLIAECAPAVIFGEQVASKTGREWLAGVRADLESLGYAVGGADLCAAGVGAPHVRQRLFWGAFRMGNPDSSRLQGCGAGLSAKPRDRRGGRASWPPGGEDAPGVDAMHLRAGRVLVRSAPDAYVGVPMLAGGGMGDIPLFDAGKGLAFWDACDVLPFRGGRRRVEPGAFPLAARLSGDVVKLRAYGNAIVPQVGAAFIGAFMESVLENNSVTGGV